MHEVGAGNPQRLNQHVRRQRIARLKVEDHEIVGLRAGNRDVVVVAIVRTDRGRDSAVAVTAGNLASRDAVVGDFGRPDRAAGDRCRTNRVVCNLRGCDRVVGNLQMLTADAAILLFVTAPNAIVGFG